MTISKQVRCVYSTATRGTPENGCNIELHQQHRRRWGECRDVVCATRRSQLSRGTNVSSRSRQKIPMSRSRLGLGYLHFVPKMLFYPNFASDINIMRQISSRYYGSVNTNME